MEDLEQENEELRRLLDQYRMTVETLTQYVKSIADTLRDANR